jgi:membrane complex biogenesis BtpA family protein
VSGLLVGVIHLPALPGSPKAELTLAAIVKRVEEEARLLEAHGFEACIVENFGDAPFFKDRVPPSTVAQMTICADAARRGAPRLNLGINVLRNDAEAAISIASALSAGFVRINVHTGARVADQGLIEGKAAETLRLRRALGADHVRIWADVAVKHSAPLAPRSLTAEVEDTVKRGLADVVLVTGEGTGKVVDLEILRTVHEASSGALVLVASGARLEDLGALAEVSNGVIVGSAVREDGRAGAPLDPSRVAAFAGGFRRAYA